ncbi:MAG: tRNA epoxyqueuosine(34) reductase QueG [Bacteroidales bacterium]
MQKEISVKIKEKALLLGFSYSGIAIITSLEKESLYLHKWLKDGFNGEMQYMENYFDKLTQPDLLIENAKSVISVLLNYYPATKIEETDNYKIAKYAYGKDYHFIIKSRLNKIIEMIQQEFPESTSRAFCDSAPVMDKVWAQRSGLGWIGKNTCLITPKAGSFFLIGEIITDIELSDDAPVKDLCGNCSRCIDSCPTNAIVAAYQLDARKCISYQTIEFKNEISTEVRQAQNDWIFGCDICQDVCPWNIKFAKPTKDIDLQPTENFTRMRKEDWKQLSKPDFNKLFKNTALERTGYLRFKRNISEV